MDASIQKYQAFVRTVELGSFTKAAESLSYSQSGVSRMVADLEREWKVALLERGRAGVRLTSEGTRLLPCIRRVCEEHARLQAQVDELNGLQAGLIRIGTFSSVATHWLPNVIRAFQEDYPNIDYELLLGDYGEIEEWVLEGRVDCGFLRLPAHRGLETAFIERDELLAVLPEGKRAAALAVLAEDPRPAYQSAPDRVYGMTFAGYDIRFSVAGGVLTVREIVPAPAAHNTKEA